MTPRRYRKPALLDRLAPGRHAVLEASAGTGKTYLLERLVADEVIRGVPLDRVLVLTFTEKATREMRERVRALLGRMARLEGDDVDPPPGEPAWTLDEEALERLRVALQAFDQAPISTIHGFCQRLLAEESFASGRRLVEEVVDGRRAFHRAFRAELRRALAAGDALRDTVLEVLDEVSDVDVLEAVLHDWFTEPGAPAPDASPEAFAAAVAPLPGAAEVSATLLPALERSGLRRGQVLESCRAAIDALGPAVDAVRGAPDAAAAVEAWRAWSGVGATEHDDRLAYLRKHLAKADPRGPLGVLAAALSAPALSPPGAFGLLVARLLPRVRARLEADKRAAGEMDFDDMVRLVADAVEDPASGLVDRIRGRFRVALIDEFQDTDEAQWRIFRRAFFDSRDGHGLRLIGDPKQAIYGFRGADVHTYLRAVEAIEGAGGDRVQLPTNWRSTPAMVAATNAVFREGFFAGAGGFTEVEAGRAGTDAVDDRDRPAAAVTLLQPCGRDPLRVGEVRATLAAAVADEIAALTGPGAPPLRVRDRGDAAPRPVRPNEIMVLTRTTAEGDEVGAALARRGVDHVFFRQEGLFDTAEAQDLRAVLRALERPNDRAARLAAFHGPYFGVPLDRLAECEDLPPDHPYLERLQEWRRLADRRDFTALFRAMWDDGAVAERALFRHAGERALTNHQHLAELLAEEAYAGHFGLPELRARLDDFLAGRAKPPGDEGDVQRLESERDCVQVMTMHKAKGLEAEVVFLFGALSQHPGSKRGPRVYRDADGARRAWLGGGAPPPDVDDAIKRETAEENDRLLYVALTRARSRLYVPYLGAPPGGAAPPASAPVRAWKRHPGRKSLHARLEARLGALAAAGAPWADHRFVPITRPVAPRPVETADLAEVSLPPAPPAPDPGPFLDARRARRGSGITSYSRLKEERAWTLDGTEEEALRGDAIDAPDAVVAAPDDGLPAGTGFGLFLHEVLERADLATVRAAPDAAAWLAEPSVRASFEGTAIRHGIATEHVDASAPLAFAALRAPLDLGPGADPLLDGVAGADAAMPELRLLYPLPGTPADGRPTDLVRGVVDLVFRVGGRTWFLDWKTDRLAAYDPASLARHVDAHYALQADLYTLGVVRMLGVDDEAGHEARFGGLLYCFLRGMRPDDGRAGVFLARPSWGEVRRIEGRLAGWTGPGAPA